MVCNGDTRSWRRPSLSNTGNFAAIRGARCRPTGRTAGSPVASRTRSTVICVVWKQAPGFVRTRVVRMRNRPIARTRCRATTRRSDPPRREMSCRPADDVRLRGSERRGLAGRRGIQTKRRQSCRLLRQFAGFVVRHCLDPVPSPQSSVIVSEADRRQQIWREPPLRRRTQSA
jgi:hypothetical protein